MSHYRIKYKSQRQQDYDNESFELTSFIRLLLDTGTPAATGYAMANILFSSSIGYAAEGGAS